MFHDEYSEIFYYSRANPSKKMKISICSNFQTCIIKLIINIIMLIKCFFISLIYLRNLTDEKEKFTRITYKNETVEMD